MGSFGCDYGMAMQIDFINTVDYFNDKPKLYPSDYTEEVIENAKDLLFRVNALMLELFELHKGEFRFPRITSGWRPAAYNKSKKGATHSWHILGRAVDLADPDGILAQQIYEVRDLLKLYGLWMERPSKTPGWVHLDTGKRPERDEHIFDPY